MRRSHLIAAITLLTAAHPVVADYREITLEGGSSITGQVLVSGKIEPLPPQPVFKQKEHCGNTLPDERLIVGENGALTNAVVYLTDVHAGMATRLDQPVKLDNKKCAFVPHVLTGTVGQTLEIHNSDPFIHDAHALLGSQTLFNVAIIKGRTVSQALMEPGMIHINCNINHTWMHAYLLVTEHPYHTVTDAQGRFRLDQVPPGTWTLRVWHEMLGSTDRHIKALPGKDEEMTIYLQAEPPPAAQ